MRQPLPEAALDQLFRTARTHWHWTDRPVTDETLRALYDLWKFGPTSANSSPARVTFVRSPEAKEKLAECMAGGNREQTLAAPVTAIVGYSPTFYEELPRLYPHDDARSWFAGNPPLIEETAFRNSTLQGAYLMLAARALGLDCGPMSGFDRSLCDALFFEDGDVRSNFLVNLGYGDATKLLPRDPRLDFAEACSIV